MLWVWPSVFTVPHFSYDAELQFEKANGEYNANGINSLDPLIETEI